MSLNITKEMIEATYDLLKKTPPFLSWNLPDSSEVKFSVIRTKLTIGTFHRDGEGKNKKPVISVSTNCVGNLPTLIHTVAHEMVHMHEDTNHKARSDVMHSARFRQLAKQVCKHHHFDEKLF